MNKYLLTLISIICFTALSVSQDLPYDKKHYNVEKNGLAIQGYDPVSYFTNKKAEEGKASISSNQNGIVYHFVNESNKKAFEANPSKYEPQYGGYCAYAMADGDKVKIDPKTFKIIDDKLYLFYNFKSTNTLSLWNANEKSLFRKAEKEWALVIKK